MSEQGKIIKPYEIALFVIAMLMIGYVITNKYGCFLATKSEKMEWTDGSSHDKLKRPKTNSEGTHLERETEETVRELSELFANTSSKTKTEGSIKRLGLTEDEEKYYKKLRSDYGFEKEVKQAQDWFSVLKTAGKTYQTMQDIFQVEKPEKGTDFYLELESQFGIPSALSKEFARQGKQKVSDWALFVEENKE